VEPAGTVAADNSSPGNPKGQNERAEGSRSKQPGHSDDCDCIPGERVGQFAAQYVVRSAEPPDKRPERALAAEDPNEPLLDLEFANSIPLPKGAPMFSQQSLCNPSSQT